jgi:hypothetical protein
VLAHVRQQGVAAACDQAHEGRLEGSPFPGLASDEVRRDMALEVVDRGERQLPRGGQRLGGGEAHQQRPNQAGTPRGGHQVEIPERRAGLLQGLSHHEVDEIQVLARGDLWNYPPEAVVDTLGGDRVGAHPTLPIENGGAGVVAARLERQDPHMKPGLGTSSSDPASVAGVRHMTRASSPLSW